MATSPNPHTLDEEIAELYAEYPELKDEMDEMELQLEAGDFDGIDHEEVRRRLQLLTGQKL